ncbi:MAG TPA: GyrI-like domain-containing protein [Phototrophicaceae bacterium]|jgi:effector-binding domain-containing protein|nr:GyrI-like domain-containing protein [Phototrophicaceae bacterium]
MSPYPSYPVQPVALKTIPAMWLVARRIKIPTNRQVPQYLGRAFDDVWRFIYQHQIKATGHCLALWYQPASVHIGEVVEAAIPIEYRVDPLLTQTHPIKVYELPQQEIASVVHHGAFKTLRPEHAALNRWIVVNGYRMAGPYRELYFNQRPGSLRSTATEIQYPVKKAHA